MWNDVTTMEGGSFYSVEAPSLGTHIDVTEQDSLGVSMWDFCKHPLLPLLGPWGGYSQQQRGAAGFHRF